MTPELPASSRADTALRNMAEKLLLGAAVPVLHCCPKAKKKHRERPEQRLKAQKPQKQFEEGGPTRKEKLKVLMNKWAGP